ncbi:MAG: hypothetical protein IPJ41_16860 [Phycisphaerales bacterium]|nr:hypothetical protein [Phycisphaerales bacterium]
MSIVSRTSAGLGLHQALLAGVEPVDLQAAQAAELGLVRGLHAGPGRRIPREVSAAVAGLAVERLHDCPARQLGIGLELRLPAVDIGIDRRVAHPAQDVGRHAAEVEAHRLVALEWAGQARPVECLAEGVVGILALLAPTHHQTGDQGHQLLVRARLIVRALGREALGVEPSLDRLEGKEPEGHLVAHVADDVGLPLLGEVVARPLAELRKQLRRELSPELGLLDDLLSQPPVGNVSRKLGHTVEYGLPPLVQFRLIDADGAGHPCHGGLDMRLVQREEPRRHLVPLHVAQERPRRGIDPPGMLASPAGGPIAREHVEVDRDLIARPILRQHPALAVEDAAADRRDPPFAVQAPLRLGQALIGPADPETEKLGGHRHPRDGKGRHQQEQTPAERRSGGQYPCHRLAGPSVCPPDPMDRRIGAAAL